MPNSHGGVTVVSRWCHGGVTVFVTVVSRWCHGGVTVGSRHGRVTVGSRWGHGGVTVGSRWGHGRVTVVSRSCHGRVTVVSRSCHGRVTVGSRSGHGRVTVGSRSGHGRVTLTSPSSSAYNNSLCGLVDGTLGGPISHPDKWRSARQLGHIPSQFRGVSHLERFDFSSSLGSRWRSVVMAGHGHFEARLTHWGDILALVLYFVATMTVGIWVSGVTLIDQLFLIL